MTEEQINKCRELSAERDNLVNFRKYLITHNDEWWKVVSASDDYDGEEGIEIPRCIRDVFISEAERKIANIDEQLKAL